MTPRPSYLLLWLMVAAGLLLRSYHYARNPVVWCDEGSLLANVLRTPLAEAFGPQMFNEPSPPFYLLLLKAVVAVLGDSEYAVRLPSLLAACGAVLLTAYSARRLLLPVWAAVAVGLLAVSDRLIWHACEAKVYSLDVCMAAGMIAFLVASARWPVWWRCLLLSVVAPVCLWISYPTCFVCGGVFVALLPAAVRGGWRGRTAYALLVLVLGIALVVLLNGPAAARRTAEVERWWRANLADWTHPERVPGWAAWAWCEVVRYCFIPFGWPLVLPAAVGFWSWWKRPVAWACGLPMAVVFAAALLGKYPFAPARTLVFLAPGLALLIGEGLRRLWGWFGPHKVWRWGFVVWVGVLLASVGWTAYRVVQPWPRLQTREAAAVVLIERTPDEPVYANYWEFDYLLRSLPSECIRVEEPSRPNWDESVREWIKGNPKRIWLIHGDPANAAFPHPVPNGYSLGRKWDFGEVQVWELKR